MKLDGSPRVPDDEGIATALTFKSITLDGKRTYKVSDDLRAFSTYDLKLEPMLNRKGQYVQVGLDGDTMVWMAGIAAVVEVDGGSSVYYTGVLKETGKDRVVFADGTVFRLGKDVRPPAEGARVVARIDTRTHRVVEMT